MSLTTQAQLMSAIVDELLELVGLQPGTVPQMAAPQAVGQGQTVAALRAEYDTHFANRKPPEGATAAQIEYIRAKDSAFTIQLAHKGAEERFLRPALDELAKTYVDVANEIARAGALRVKLRGMVTDAVSEALKDTIIAGATEAEAVPLRQERVRLLAALADPPKGGAEPDAKALQATYRAVEIFTGQVTALQMEVAARTAAREKLTRDLADVIAPVVTDPKDIVPGAIADEVKPLWQERNRIAAVIADKDATLPALNAEFTKVSALRADKGNAFDVVAARVQRKDACIQQAREAIDTLPGEASRVPLDRDHTELKRLLATDPLGEAPLVEAEKALAKLKADIDFETDTVREYKARKLAFEPRVLEVRALVDGQCSGFKTSNAIKLLGNIEAELKGPVRAIDFDGLGAKKAPLETRLSDVRRAIAEDMQGEVTSKGAGKAQEALEFLRVAGEAAWQEGQSLLPFAKYRFTKALRGLEGQRDEILALVTPKVEAPVETGSSSRKKGNERSKAKAKAETTPPRFEDVQEAFTTLAQMRATIDEVRQDVGDVVLTITDMRDAALKVVAPPNPPRLPPGYDAILDARRTAVTVPLGTALTNAVTIDLCNTAKKDAALFGRDHAAASDISLSWAACQDFTTVRDAARPAMQAELDTRRTAVLAAGQLSVLASDLPGAVTLCRRLQDLLATARQEGGKEKDTKLELSKLTVEGKAPDKDTIALVYDLAGPDAIESLAARPATLVTLATCCKKATSEQKDALRALVAEGLGPSGKVLANLARGGDADAILALATAYAGPTQKENRGRLRAMVEEGGLAEQPAVLGDMLGFGVAGARDEDKDTKRANNVARIKDMGNAFGKDEGPGLLRKLAGGCGLGAARPDDPSKPNEPSRPGVLSELLLGAGGLGGDVPALRTLAEEFGGDGPADQTHRDRLKGLIEDGGFGGRPRAFGPLVGTLKDKMPGGMKGAATKLKEVGKTFEGATDRQRLKGVLENGGMSGDVEEPNRTHEHSDTLAKVFAGGLTARADKLKDFTDAFGANPGHTEQCRKMMESWNEFPEQFKGDRKPGDKIKLLLDEHFGDDVSRLQTQFTATLDPMPDDKRKLATRFGPNLLKRNPPGNIALPGLDVARQNDPQRRVDSVVSGFIMKRHCPEFARDGTKANGDDWLTDPQSYFPVGTTPGDLANIMTEAFNDPNGPDRGRDATVPSQGMDVEIALRANGTSVHCFPTSGPPTPDPKEIAQFSKAQAQLMFNAVRP